MRSYEELAAAIKSGGSIRMPDGEVIRTEERLRALHPESGTATEGGFSSASGDPEEGPDEAGDSESVSVPKAELQEMVESYQRMEEENASLTRENDSLKQRVAELEKEKAAPAAGNPDALPEGFPGRPALEKAGITTRTQIAGMDREALIGINGIAEKTADEILAAREG